MKSMNRSVLFVFLAVLVLLPLVPATPEFWVTQINYIGLASLVALGLMLLTGVGGLTSFGQAAFVGLGAYATAYLTTRYGVSPWLGLPAGLVVTGVVAWLLGLITLRLSGHYLPLGTIAWGLSLYFLFGNIEALGEHNGIAGIEPISFFGVSLLDGRHIYFLIWACVLLSLWATRNLLDSRPGRAIRALRNGANMAESMGVNTAQYKIVIFVWAALLASLSGWLYAHMQRAVSPSPFGLNYGIEYLFMVVVGGSSSVWGALLGAALILVIKDQLQDLLPALLHTDANFELIVFGVLMILMLQYSSNGLWPILAGWWSRAFGGQGAQRGREAPPEAPALAQRLRPEAGQTVLEVRGLRKQFGGLVAVNDISFTVRAGEIMGLIGPNGAGKSTTFNLVSGVLPATRGEVLFLGERIDGLSARAIALRGVGRTFQHVQLLPTMTVLENVALGAHMRSDVGVFAGALHADRAREAQLLHEAARQLQRVGLGNYLYEQAGNLALGQQRILEIARALACDPVLLLLDEPAAGLRYKEKQELAQVLEHLRDEGMSILLVEHDMDFVMRLTNHLVVMDFGTKLAEGAPESVRENPAVLEAYLGGIDDDLPESIQGAAPITEGKQ
jgi:branched-chain amino acid transport system permease protein